MTPTPNPNRRQSHRAPISIAVRQRIGARTVLCQANDISLEGIQVASVYEGLDQERSKCLLEFSLPGSHTIIAARGHVVRQRLKGRYHLSAIRFSVIAPSHRRLIQRYIGSPTLAPPPTEARLARVG